MNKKIIVFFALFFISFNALALLPLLTFGARVVGAAFRGPSGQMYAAGTAMAIGTFVQSFYFSRQGTDGSTREDEINFTSQPRQPRPGAETDAGFTAGYPSLVPPSTTPELILYRSTSPTGIVKYSDSHSAACVYAGAVGAGGIAPSSTSSGSCINPDGVDVPNVVGYIRSCQTGYVNYNGAVTCTLSDASVIKTPLDGYCPIVRNGNSYSVDTADGDCNGSSANPQFAPDGTATISSADGRSITITGLGTNGAMRVTEKIPNAAAGTTQTTTTDLQAGATTTEPYIVIGSSVADHVGTGTAATDIPVSSSASPDVVQAINTQTATIANIEAARVEKENNDRIIPPFTDVIPKETIPVSFTGISFASQAVCPPPITYNMLGTDYFIAYDPMCNLMSLMRPLFLALGAFSAGFIFMGAFKV